MKNKLIVIFLLFFLGCTSSSEKVLEEKGFVTLLVSAKNNNLLFFKFSLDNIFLVDDKNNYINITGGENYAINFSKLEGRSEVLLKVAVPSGTYYGVAVDANVSQAVVKSINEGKVVTPGLFDSYGSKVTDIKTIYRIESNFDADGPLRVLPDQVTSLSLSLDVDASLRLLALDDNDNSNMLIYPVFYVSRLVSFPSAVDIKGKIEAVDKKKLSLTPFHSTASIDIPFNESATLRVAGKDVDVEGLLKAIKNKRQSIVTVRLSLVNGVRLEVMDYFEGADVYRYEGYINKRNDFIGSKEVLGSGSTGIQFIKKAVKKADNRDVPLAVTALTLKKTLPEWDQFETGMLQLVGTVTSKNTQGFEFSVMSVGALDASLFFDENETITVSSKRSFSASSDLISLLGKVTDNRFQSINEAFIDEREQRMLLSLPLSSDDSVFKSVKREALVINKRLSDELFSYLKISEWSIYENVDDEIKKIIVDFLPTSLMVVVNSKPYFYDVFQLRDLSDFTRLLDKMISEGSVVDAVVADGVVKEGVFLATNMVVSFSLRKEHSSGVGLSGHEPPFLTLRGLNPESIKKGLYKLNKVLLMFDTYGESNTKGIKKAKLRKGKKPKGPGNWRYLRDKWVDMDAMVKQGDARVFGTGEEAKDVSSARKSSDLIRNIGLKNPETGEFIARQINYFDKKGFITEGSLSLAERLNKISDMPLFKVLGDGVDEVNDFRTKQILQDYMSAVKNDDIKSMKSNMFHESFSDEKNKPLLAMLMVEIPDDYDLKLSHRSINGLMVENDKSGTLMKLLRHNPDTYKQIYIAYQDLMVKSIFSGEGSLNKIYGFTVDGDEIAKQSFVDKLSKKISELDSSKINQTFKQINEVITDSIQKQGVSLGGELSEVDRKKLLSTIDKAIKSSSIAGAVGDHLKYYASSFNVEDLSTIKPINVDDSGNKVLSMDKFSIKDVDAGRTKVKSKQSWSVDVLTTPVDFNRNLNIRQPVIRKKN